MKAKSKFSMVATLGFFLSYVLGLGQGFLIADTDKSPLEIVKARNETIENILDKEGDEVSADTKEKLKEVITGVMDFRELSRRSLGKYWDERTEQEQADFTDVFSKLIKNSSVKKLEIYKADKLVYEEPEINGVKAKVTTIAYEKRKQVEIVYRMHIVGDEWRVYDMEIDGVSTARNYRDSFYKQIAKTSYEEMYNKLVKKLNE
ncbi:ABC transporter substrate-binding protein [bacterium]|nr:ABC transporter substrate-binding protein [bacterium]